MVFSPKDNQSIFKTSLTYFFPLFLLNLAVSCQLLPYYTHSIVVPRELSWSSTCTTLLQVWGRGRPAPKYIASSSTSYAFSPILLLRETLFLLLLFERAFRKSQGNRFCKNNLLKYTNAWKTYTTRKLTFTFVGFKCMALIHGSKLFIYYFIYTALGNFDS